MSETPIERALAGRAMSADAMAKDEFKLEAKHFNAALQAAGSEGLSVQDRPEGLWLDSADLEYQEVVDKLLNGLVALHYGATP